MRTVYLIGNGFDINLGLPTKYSDFYKHYLDLDRSNDSECVSKLKDHLEKNLSANGKYWSDLEDAMGMYTTEISSYAELEEVYDDLNDEMQKYISTIEKSALPAGINAGLLKKNISSPQTFLTPAEQIDINSLYNRLSYNTHQISIVNFNYTTTIEKILNFQGQAVELAPATYHAGYKTRLIDVYHIHGKSDRPVLGINDVSQIHNEKLRKNPDVIEYLVKPTINSTLGHLIDKNAKDTINRANLICIYGLSLGKTDALWWKLVGERLLSGVTVILYVYDENAHNLVPRKLGRFLRHWKTKLCEAAEIQNSKRDSVMHRIIVAPNTSIFNIKE